MESKLKPIKLTDGKGNEYVLEFNRETVRFAENRGFDISELTKFPQSNIPALFFYSFRKNHRNVSRSQTDTMLESLGGLTADEIERLVLLYNQPTESLILVEEGARKNSKMTVEL